MTRDKAQLHADIEPGVAALVDGDDWQRWLAVAARFPKYRTGAGGTFELRERSGQERRSSATNLRPRMPGGGTSVPSSIRAVTARMGPVVGLDR